MGENRTYKPSDPWDSRQVGPVVSCGPCWYPILARFAQRLSDLEVDYEGNQIKEKLFGADHNSGSQS